MHVFFVGWSLCQPLFSLRSGCITRCLLPEEKMPNFVRRMPCCLTSRAMAISFLHRSTGTAPQAFSPRRRCRTLFAGCGGSVPSPSSAFRRLPHFQSSMLLHNLSSVFSLGRKASQRARRGSRVPHQRPPRHSPANRPAPRHSPANRPAPRHTRQPTRTTPLPGQPAQRRPHSPLRQVFHRLSTEFSTFLPVFHSGFLSPWLSWRETASDLLSRGFFLQRKTRYGTVLYGTVRYGAA